MYDLPRDEERAFGLLEAEFPPRALHILAQAWYGPYKQVGPLGPFALVQLVEDFLQPDKIPEMREILQNLRACKTTPQTLSLLVDLDLISQEWFPKQSQIEEKSMDERHLDSIIAIATRMRAELQPFERTCDVCLEDHPGNDFAEIPITGTCDHDRNTCRTDLAKHIRVQLENRPYNLLTCVSCPALLTAEDIKLWASPETFIRYCDLAFLAFMRSDPNFQQCLVDGCPSGQINNANTITMFCDACSRRTCIRHQVPWHTGMTCDEYDEHLRLDGQRNEENAASIALIAAIAKICRGPGCQVSILKDGGCDHFTCDRCQYQFCWLCLCHYENIRTASGWRGHRVHCPYHHPSMPPSAPLNPNHYLEDGPDGRRRKPAIVAAWLDSVVDGNRRGRDVKAELLALEL